MRSLDVIALGKESVVHSFMYSEGDTPAGGVVQDGSGNLYGTTTTGGLRSHRNRY